MLSTSQLQCSQVSSESRSNFSIVLDWTGADFRKFRVLFLRSPWLNNISPWKHVSLTVYFLTTQELIECQFHFLNLSHFLVDNLLWIDLLVQLMTSLGNRPLQLAFLFRHLASIYFWILYNFHDKVCAGSNFVYGIGSGERGVHCLTSKWCKRLPKWWHILKDTNWICFISSETSLKCFSACKN